MASFDAIVVGGGLVGSAIAYGIARNGWHVALLDEGDVAYRAARGNFGLVWVQSKGAGVPEYQRWTRLSADGWADFAAELRERTGVDCGHRRPGGVTICLTERDFAERNKLLEGLRQDAGAAGFDYRMLDHGELAKLLPVIGPEVYGAAFTPYDGHANPLYTLRALHAALTAAKGRYVPNASVSAIKAAPHAFEVEAGGERFTAPKLVLAAGLGNRALAPHVGLDVPVDPVRGQIIVTERVRPLLPLPTLTIRQTAEGGFMIGESREEVGFDDDTSVDVLRRLARTAVTIFPFLAGVGIVRTWAALRVMSPDGLPVYDQSARYPGAFVATCHSGVTLAAAHATRYAEAVIEGRLPEMLDRFSGRRFDVQAAA
ncbi:MAG TPA: FAD-dependent oxidoreductase [Burkholderiales bacterium]|nr:FAD-dependent oxidoreductase [Burkholderiales bacterium]